MLFAVLKLAKYLILMAAVIFGTALFRKLKLKESARKIAHLALVLGALIFFFIPFDEILTFQTPEKAFSATVFGETLAEDTGNQTTGFFFRDQKGTFSTVFYYEENGRYRMCPSEDRILTASGNENGIYTDLYRIGDTKDAYLLVRGYVPSLSVQTEKGDSYEVKTIQTSQGTLFYLFAFVEYEENETVFLINDTPFSSEK